MVIFVIPIFHKLQILADWNRAHAKLAKFSTLFKSHAGGISEKLGVPTAHGRLGFIQKLRLQEEVGS